MWTHIHSSSLIAFKCHNRSHLCFHFALILLEGFVKLPVLDCTGLVENRHNSDLIQAKKLYFFCSCYFVIAPEFWMCSDTA